MLNIHFKSSRILAALLIFMHALSLLLIWIIPISFWAKLFITPVLLVSVVFYLRRDALLTLKSSSIALQIHSDCQCEIQNFLGEWVDAMLKETSFVSPYLTVLNFSVDGKSRIKHIVIFPDAVNSEHFRQLRVLLKWKCNRFEQASSIPFTR